MAVLLCLGLCRAADVTAGKETSRETTYKVLTCNVRMPFDEDYKNGDGWEQRKEFCRDVIAAEKADIICLQESRAPQLAIFNQGWKEFERFGLADPKSTHAAMLPGLSIYFNRSRLEKVDSGGFWLSETPEVPNSKSWGSGGNVYVNWVQLRDRKTALELRVWNTHLDASSVNAREHQARAAAVVAAALPASLPQIFAGDFNADASDPSILAMKEGGWTDSYSVVHGPKDPGFTFHEFKGPAYGERKNVKGKIDFIFTRGPLVPVTAEIIKTSRDGHYPSDHYFVSTELRTSR